MTAPDPTPYLRETDLRTAEDALAYQLTLLEPDPDVDLTHAIVGPWAVTLPQAIILTAARLDRERRQACRRGALVSWRAASRIIRAAKDRRGRRRDRALTAAVWAPPWAPSSEDARLARSLLDHLSCALAFRAAARTP